MFMCHEIQFNIMKAHINNNKKSFWTDNDAIINIFNSGAAFSGCNQEQT